MEEILVGKSAVAVYVRSIEANNVAALIFDPDVAIETADAVPQGMNFEDRGANGAEKFAADIAEGVVLLIEAAGIDEHHVHEARRGVATVFKAQCPANLRKCVFGAL